MAIRSTRPSTPRRPSRRLPSPSRRSRAAAGRPSRRRRSCRSCSPGDPLAASITSFTTKIAASDYWKTQAAEYKVGPITPGATITVSEAAPATITSPEIETWLQGKLSGATPEFGAPDENTLYAIYYPASTTISDDGSGLGQSCQGYGGYHFEVEVGGKTVGYAVMPRCSDIDELTVAASHEYYEWATDPFPQSNPAFCKLDDQHWAWGVTMIGELGDLCTFLDRDNLRPAEIGFLVQREWSNKASLAGKYPCAPAKTSPYLQAITEADDDVDVPDQQVPGKYLTTKAIKVPPGGSRTVDALIYSDQKATPLVPLRALSQADFGGSGSPSGFTFELSKNYVKVGDYVKVTINAPKEPGYDILVMTAYTGPDSAHYWPVLLVNDDSTAAQGKRPVVTAEMIRSRAHASTRSRTRVFTKLGLAKPLRVAP